MMTLSLGEGRASVSDLFLPYEYATNAVYGWVEICGRHALLPSTEKIKYFLTF